MKKILILVIILLSTSFATGQNLKANDDLCVINISGAKVYQKPTFNSEILNVLSVGEKISVEKSVVASESLKIGNGFNLSGNWIKPMGSNGFIFSSDLTNKKVEITKSKDGNIFINLLGTLKNKNVEKKNVKSGNYEFQKIFEYEYYENGTYTNIAWDGCFEHLTEYKNLTFNEVYHQMVSDYGIRYQENDFWAPIFKEKVGNTIKFEGEGATQDLKIQVMENGNIAVSSYDCT